jgi:DNA-binding IclR family transcriptional regulator
MINSVLKALDILSVFSPTEPRLTLAEISRRLGLPKSTTHNLLATLLSRGYVEKVDGDHYALGTAVIPLTQSVRVNVELRDRAAPLLRELADACRESVYLAVLDHGYCLYIYAIESPRRLLARTAVGDRVHPHCTSLGKAILAYLPEKDVEQIIAQLGLPSFTESTITDPAKLRRELAEVRTRGYAIDRGEHEPGTYCVGAPVVDDSGRVVGACSISAADPEVVGTRVEEFSGRVVQTAQEISRRMGYVAPSRMRIARQLLGREEGARSLQWSDTG